MGSPPPSAGSGPGPALGEPPDGRRPGRALQAAREDPLQLAWARAKAFDRLARVDRTEWLTSTGTVRLTLEVVDDQPLAFRPGQFVTVLAGHAPGRSQSPYAICTPPGLRAAASGRPLFALLVRVVPDGPVARYLGGLVPGDVVVFRGPLGRSMVPPTHDHDLVLVATGVGIGPFLGLARTLLDEGFPRPVLLAWGLRQREDLCLLDELQSLAAAHPTFRSEVGLSRPPAGWQGRAGRLGEWLPDLVDEPERCRYSLCGNGAMVEEMAAALSEVGVPADRVHGEPYFKRYHHPDPEVVHRIAGRFRRQPPVLPGIVSPRPFPLASPLRRG